MTNKFYKKGFLWKATEFLFLAKGEFFCLKSKLPAILTQHTFSEDTRASVPIFMVTPGGIQVTLSGEILNEIGLLVDFSDIKRMVKEAADLFDHKLINDIEPFGNINPSSENLAKYFFESIKKGVSIYRDIKDVKVLVSESRDTSAVYLES